MNIASKSVVRDIELVLQDWFEIIHGTVQPMSRAARTARRRRISAARWRFRLMTAVTVVAALLGICVFVWIGVAQSASRRQAVSVIEQAVIENTDTAVQETRRTSIAEARDYNTKLASTPQIIGEVLTDDGTPAGDFTFDGDDEYRSLLDMGDSIMGALRIPKIGLLLPIRHGAGEYALSNGLGHLHGTSLPVGGVSTHAVVTGHRGLADKELFTRLDELTVGDPFYIELADGTTLGYRIEHIVETDPNDTDRLRIESGLDQVTLVTCTPIMLNTRRLLVTGIRASMPDIVPVPQSAPGDNHPKTTATIASSLCAGIGWFALARGTRRRNRFAIRPQHIAPSQGDDDV